MYRIFTASPPPRVALLAEGVDRNRETATAKPTEAVALLAEGVDRNCVTPCLAMAAPTSPSSRRAWIEIEATQPERWIVGVALLAEGVDRNAALPVADKAKNESPSSRRAWIEIHQTESSGKTGSGRPPRGGRG